MSASQLMSHRRLLALSLALATGTTLAGPAFADRAFNRVSTFLIADNLPVERDSASVTVSEIVAASEDGTTLIYTDSPQDALGFIDITSPSSPIPAGFVPLPGEPTSVAVSGGVALVAVNESDGFVNVAGDLVAIDITSKEILATCALGGQPDSIAAGDGFVAIAI